MALKGDLESISLPSLFQLLESEKKTGVLTIQSNPYERHLYVYQGMVVFLLSQDPKDLFGQFLLRKQLISENVLIEALRSQEEKAGKLGEILEKLASISEEKIKKQLKEKLKESIYQLFLLQKSNFHFDEQELEFQQIPNLEPINIQALLMEGLSQYDEYKKLKVDFPNEGQTFVVHREKFSKNAKSGEIHARILDQLEKGASIADLCFHFHAYEYPILRLLSDFLKASIIEYGEVRKYKEEIVVSKPREDLVALGQKLEIAGDLIKAQAAYKDVLGLDPSHTLARERLKEVQRILSENLSKTTFHRSSIFAPKENLDWNDLHLKPLEGFVLSRLNGTWRISDILSVVPAPEAEVFLALKNLLDMGIIRKK